MSRQSSTDKNPAGVDDRPPGETAVVWLPAEQLIDQSPDGGVAAPETFPEQVDAASLGPPVDARDDDPEISEDP